jgi:hypothetical protein
MGEPATATTDPGVYVPEAGQVAIRDPDGSVWKIPQEQLAEASHQGARPATETEYFGAKYGKAGEVQAGLAGAARGATFGLSDAAYVETARALGGESDADEMRNLIRLTKQSSSNASLGGELFGMGAGAVATGGLGGAAEAGIGRGVAGVLGEGAAARFAARAASAAPRAFAEGAAMGVGGQLSEDTLSNHKLASEAYLSAGLKGGALGLLLGAGGAGALGAAGDKAGALFGRGERTALQAEEGLASRVAKLEEGAPYRAAATAEEAAAETGGRKSLITTLEEKANEQAYKATGANRTDWKALGRTAEEQAAEAQTVGQRLRSETFEGKPIVEPLASEAEINRRVVGRANEVGKELSAMRAKLDTAAERPAMSAIRNRFETEVAGPALEELGGAEAVAKARAKLDEMAKLGGEAPSFEKLYKLRRGLEPLAKYSQVAPKAEVEMFRALRNITEDEFTSAGERAAKEIGETFADNYRLKKALYADLATAREASNRATARSSGNNAFSLTDAVVAAGSMASGNLGAAAAIPINMVRRKYGNQIAAHVLGTATKMEMVQRAAAKLDSLIDSGAKAFVSNSKTATRATKSFTTADVRAAREATRSPEAVSARVAEAIGDMPKYAPKVAQEIATTASRAAAWMQHTLPKEEPPMTPQFGKKTSRPLSDTQLLKARAIMETVEDGSIVIDRLRQGRLTDDHVATLKYVHPETYAKIQAYLTQHATELNKTMTQQQLFRLSLLFGQPLTEAALPENVRALQASFTQGNQAPGPGGSGGNTGPKMSGGPVNIGQSQATQFDKVEAGAQ